MGKCIVCKTNTAFFKKPDQDYLWCYTCAVKDTDPKFLKAYYNICKDCRLVLSTWGVDGRSKWCYNCAKNHKEAVRTKKRKECKCGKGTASYAESEDKIAIWCVDCKEDGAFCKTYHRRCEDCKRQNAYYGTTTGDAKWCLDCSKNHNDVILCIERKKCEDCKKISPSYGYATENSVRFCATCADNHENVEVKNGLCETCRKVRATYGLKDDERRRWCVACKPEEARIIFANLCEVCKEHQCVFGLKGTKQARWCKKCIPEGIEAENVVASRCQDCKLHQPTYGIVGGLPKWCAACGKKNGGVDLYTKKCEDCKEKSASFGYPDQSKRWCSACSKKYEGAVDIVSQMCEDCGIIRASFSDITVGKRKWCRSCAEKNTENPISLSRKCEDCSMHQPLFGYPYENARWCSNCADSHVGAVDLKTRMCEDCRLVRPSFGYDGKRTWCAACAVAHPGAKTTNKLCEECGLHQSNFGLSDGKARWCKNCSSKYEGADNVTTRRCENVNCITKSQVPTGRRSCLECDPSIAPKFNVKEKAVLHFILKQFPDVIWTHDKAVGGDKTCDGKLKRPDIVADCLSFQLVIEVDEHQHICPKYGGQLCEIKRMYDIMASIGLPCVWIRYNPDKYSRDGVVQKTCEKTRRKALTKLIHTYLSKSLESVDPKVYYMYYDDHPPLHEVEFEKLLKDSVKETQILYT